MTKDINLDCGHPYGQEGEEAPVASLPLAPVEPTSAGPAWTAGPWVARDAPRGYIDIDAPNDGCHWNIATVITPCGPTGRDGEANARLISAAPDLYEALAGIKWRSADRDNMEFDGRVTTWQLDAIKAALAKARGQ